MESLHVHMHNKVNGGPPLQFPIIVEREEEANEKEEEKVQKEE